MKIRLISIVAGLAASVATLSPSVAFDLEIDEARIGGSVLDIPYTALVVPFGDEKAGHRYNLPGMNAEVLFKAFDFGASDTDNSFLRTMLSPRLHVGTTISFDDDTASSLYSGLTWHHGLGEYLFIETSFGGAVHNGDMDPKPINATQTTRGLGSTLLFRESVAIGANLSPDLTLVVQISHMSHADLAGDQNDGQTDLSVKLGKKF